LVLEHVYQDLMTLKSAACLQILGGGSLPFWLRAWYKLASIEGYCCHLDWFFIKLLYLFNAV